jgi:hypothetical protein
MVFGTMGIDSASWAGKFKEGFDDPTTYERDKSNVENVKFVRTSTLEGPGDVTVNFKDGTTKTIASVSAADWQAICRRGVSRLIEQNGFPRETTN